MNYCCGLLINLDFCLKHILYVSASQDVYATILWHCQSAADQSCPIHCYDFYKNVIITSLYKEYLAYSVKLPSVDIHLRIFTESFINLSKNCEKNMKKQMCHFFSEHGVVYSSG